MIWDIYTQDRAQHRNDYKAMLAQVDALAKELHHMSRVLKWVGGVTGGAVSAALATAIAAILGG